MPQGVPVLIQVGKGQSTLGMRTITYPTTELNSVIQPVTDQNSNNSDIVEIGKKGYIMQREIRDYENAVTKANRDPHQTLSLCSYRCCFCGKKIISLCAC